MEEYSQNEIIRFFESTVNPALKGFESELLERGWRIEDIQILPAFWHGNTLTGEIWATKKGEQCFSYKIRVEPSPKDTPDSYHLQFKYGYCKGDVEKSDVTDHYKPNMYIVTADDFLEHIKEVYNNSIGMIR